LLTSSVKSSNCFCRACSSDVLDSISAASALKFSRVFFPFLELNRRRRGSLAFASEPVGHRGVMALQVPKRAPALRQVIAQLRKSMVAGCDLCEQHAQF